MALLEEFEVPVVSLMFFVVCLFAALIVGVALGAFIARGRPAAVDPEAVRALADANAAQVELARMRERASRVATLESEAARLTALVESAREDVLRMSTADAQKTQQVASLRARVEELERDAAALGTHLRAAAEALQAEKALHAEQREASGRSLSQLAAELAAEREASADKLRVLQDAKLALTDQFKSLANDILEEKSKRFAEQNQQNLGTLLDPLRTQLSEFKGKVEEVYVQEGKDRSALSEQVRQLMELNQTLSRDANNLTKALKGSAKTQGNWGELILERVLEASGLRKGHEYHVQDSQRTDDGKLQQPDVVIDLPEQRKIVVDAKVSLVAYDRYTACESEEDRAAATRLHLDSVRAHVKGLSGKSYQSLYGLKSLDFVLMFVPIEPAFMLAVTHDDALFMDAWERNVLLVSPSTLLFVVRTVAHLWRQEAQGRNAQEIARRGADLYDKLQGFVVDLQKVGERLGGARDAYDEAFKKLHTGRGNVIRQAEMLRDLGVKPGKALPQPLVEAALDGEATAPAVALPSLFDALEPPAA